jgi:F0F1-type ATP synthase membrane subunit b/b'
LNRLIWIFIPALALAAEESHGGAPDLTVSKWIHFGLLVLAVLWLWRKNATPAFRTRAEQITKDLADARRAKAESDAKVADIERRLGNLSGEIQSFRAESEQLIGRETERISLETGRMFEKVTDQGAAEIESAFKAAKTGLRIETARLAVQLATQKIERGLTPETHAALLSSFAERLPALGEK